MIAKREEEIHGFQTASSYSYGLLKQFAAENRKNMTWAERCLWARLSNNQYRIKFRRQHIIGSFIADFACLSCKLIIEVDGGYHAQYQQQIDDTNRTFDLTNLGYTVIRFTNDEITKDPNAIADKIFTKVFELLENKENNNL